VRRPFGKIGTSGPYGQGPYFKGLAPHGSVTYLQILEVHAMTLDAFLETVYVPLRLRGRSRESVRLLRHAITQFSRWLGRPSLLDDLDDLVVSQFLAARAAKLSPNSVARERSGILALWNLAQARGLVRLRPCVAPELVPEQTPRAFTADELVRLAAAARLASGWIGPVPAQVFFPALIAVGLETGERINAILRTPRHCWHRPTLTVPARIRKGGRVERVYELSPEACDLVDQVVRHEGPTVFWWVASDTALRKRWKTITRRAGLGEGREVQFHALRRSTASHLAAAGLDATAYLGHSTDRTTRRSYYDPRVVNANRPKAWQSLPRVFKPDPEPPARSA
jgi:integrase